MQCIFFDTEETCQAHPPHLKLTYKPDKEVKDKYCKNKEFIYCNRYTAFLDYLEAVKS